MSDSRLSGSAGVGVLVVGGLVQDDEGGEDRCPPGRLTTGGGSAERGFEFVHRGERSVLIGAPGVSAGTGDEVSVDGSRIGDHPARRGRSTVIVSAGVWWAVEGCGVGRPGQRLEQSPAAITGAGGRGQVRCSAERSRLG